MKVLVVSKYYEPFKGGIESVVCENAVRLAAKGHDVTVLASSHDKSLPKTETMNGVKVIRMPTLFKFNAAPVNPTVLSEVLGQKFDICMLHEPNSFNNPLAFWALSLRKKKYVITYHSDIIGREGLVFGSLFRLYKNVFQKAMLRGAKRIMPTSPQYIEISDTLPDFKYKTTVIPNGVDLEKFKPAIEGRKQNEVFFAGRLIYYKGVDVLIDAMKEVVKEIPDAHLSIAGTGNLEDELKAKVSGMENNITFLGKISDEELSKRFAESTVFVLPSVFKSEAFGVVILESLASGCPVITTDVSGTVYAAGDNSLIVKHGNTQELAKAILLVLKNEALQKRMSEKGLEHVQNFTWDKVAAMTEKVLEDALNG